jgi:hypothetical protein
MVAGRRIDHVRTGISSAVGGPFSLNFDRLSISNTQRGPFG